MLLMPMKEIITEAHTKYANECLEAVKNWPERHLTVEQMRAQVKRIHEAVLAEQRCDITPSILTPETESPVL